MKNLYKGFTLLELIVAMALLSILSAMAYKSYSSYTDYKYEAQAKQEILRLAVELEKYKSNNFTYAGFPTASVSIPKDVAADKVKYNITVVNPVTGVSLVESGGGQWGIKAIPSTRGNPYFVMNSMGLQCQTTTAPTYRTCGTPLLGASNW